MLSELNDDKKSVATSTCTLDLEDKNLIEVTTFKNASIEIPQVKEIHKALLTLTNSEPCYLLVLPAIGTTSSNEARQYAASIKKHKNIVAEAIVVNTLPLRLLASFFIKVNKPRQKVKIFSNASSARRWLHEIMEEQKN